MLKPIKVPPSGDLSFVSLTTWWNLYYDLEPRKKLVLDVLDEPTTLRPQ